MRLTAEQIDTYDTQGYLLVEGCFNARELARLRDDLPAALAEASPRRVLERDGVTVRGVHGQHTSFASFADLVRHPRLVLPAQRLLAADVFVYQFKINAKAAFSGDSWPWHQDFIFWQREDGMREPALVTALVMLDDSIHHNGPLLVFAGSHREGAIPVEPPAPRRPADAPAWLDNLTADLKYALPRERMRELGERYPLREITGPAGSVLFFHPNLVHGSSSNMSPHDRRYALVTYNSVANQLRPVERPRPDFLVNRDCTPIVAAEDDVLLAPEVLP